MAYPTHKSQYDFSLFEMKTGSAANVSTAPKVSPEEKRPQMRVVVNRNKKPEARVLANGMRRNSVAKAGAVLLIMLVALGMMIYLQAKLDNVNRQVARTQQTLEETKSETVRLQMELNSIVSIDKVEDYAVNTLGMVKIESGQVEYIDLSGDDKIIVADGENEFGDVQSTHNLNIGEYGD